MSVLARCELSKLLASLALAGVVVGCGSSTRDSAQTDVDGLPSPAPSSGSPTPNAIAGEVEAEAQRIFAKRFAGIWISGEGVLSIVHVGVTDLSDADRKKWMEQANYDSTAVLENRRYTAAQLIKFKRQADDYLASKDSLCLVEVGVRENEVHVVLPRSADPSVKDGLSKMIPKDAVRYSVGDCNFRA